MTEEEKKERLREAYRRHKQKPEAKALAKISRSRRDQANREKNLASLPVGEKRCPKCQVVKSYDEFHILLTSLDGRQVKCRTCVSVYTLAHRDEGNERSRAWYIENKDHKLEVGRRWLENNRDRQLAKAKEYREANKEKINSVITAWSAANSEKVKAYQKAWSEANRDKCAAKMRRWRKLNPMDPAKRRILNQLYRKCYPDRVRAYQQKKRAKRRGAEGRYAGNDISRLLLNQKCRCANTACRISLKSGYHIDHIVPLSRGGSNWIRNIQLLCKACNLKKHAKSPLDWAQENGLLL